MIYLSIGSNLKSVWGNKIDNINKCIFLISKFAKIKDRSNFYKTPSYPNRLFPNFVNVIIRIEYKGNPHKLLRNLNLIEKFMGRIKRIKNSPRVCDIDIIDFNGLVIENKILNLPHPGMHKRNFVLFPLRDVSPNWHHPVTNKNIDFLTKKLSRSSHIEITRIR